MLRHRALLILTSIAGVAFDQSDAFLGRTPEAAGPSTILVVSDGLRWQEVFRGADSALLSGAPGDEGAAVRRRYWRPTIGERRKALMPFVWSVIERDGVLLGNRDAGTEVDVMNAMKFSYPGYNEMLVGVPDPRIDRNDFGPNPNVTVFESLNRQEAFRGRVAAFGTWDTFHDIFNAPRSGIAVHTNGAKPHDALVQRAALPFLEKHHPRAVFIGFAETDDWGHEGRYDRFLDAANAVDRYLGELWSAVQADPAYRDRTTIVFAADHGRGRTPADWRHHGNHIPGAGETFILTIGPGTAHVAAGRVPHVLGEVAELIAASVGHDYSAVVSTVRNR